MSNPTSVPTVKVVNNRLVIALPDNMDPEAAMNVPMPADQVLQALMGLNLSSTTAGRRDCSTRYPRTPSTRA